MPKHHNGTGFGAGMLGRLKYRTAEEARGAARDLGLRGVHSHTMNGERVWMPGSSHAKLNEALRERGREPTMKPGGGGGMDMDSGMQMDMDRAADIESVDELQEMEAMGVEDALADVDADFDEPDLSDVGETIDELGDIY